MLHRSANSGEAWWPTALGARWPTSSVGDANRKRVRVEAAAGAKETDARVGGIAVWHNKDKTRQEFQLGQRCFYPALAENCLCLLLTVTVAPH